jgi:hypothetical protein
MLASCGLLLYEPMYDPVGMDTADALADYSVIPEVSFRYDTPEEYMWWVQSYMEEVRDPIQFGENEYWQTPEECLVNKRGDCEDFVILWMFACKLRLGIKPMLYAYYYELPDGRKAGHAVGVYDRKIYDGTGFHKVYNEYAELMFTMDYDTAMYEARYERSVYGSCGS